jgi:hypothetical protein
MTITCCIDDKIGPWCVKQSDSETKEKCHCIAIVNNIEAFGEAVFTAIRHTENKALKDKLYAMLDFVEFGEVKVSKTGVVKWQGGKFANADIEH